MISINKLRIASLWIIGILGCACKWDPVVLPKVAVFLVCMLPCMVVFFFFVKKRRIKKNFFLLWYGLFFLLVCASLLYTANHIDANDVVRRCFLGFTLGFCASQLLEKKSDLKCIVKGLIVGALLTMAVTLKMEMHLIGFVRMGNVTCGAATAYSGILLIGLIGLFILSQVEKKRIYVFFELFLLVGIVLSGSRMPLLMAGICFGGMKIAESGVSFRMVTNVIKIVAVVGCVGYAVMTNPILYDIAGRRIESMLDSVQYGVDKNVDSSLNERSEMKTEALRLWAASPIYGQGVNSFWILSSVKNRRASSHCGYTEILCSFGVLGLILFYWPFLKPIARITRLKKDLATSIAIVLAIFLVMEWQGGYFDSCTHIVFWFVLFQFVRDCDSKYEEE